MPDTSSTPQANLNKQLCDFLNNIYNMSGNDGKRATHDKHMIV
jgi:hypothetical protein